MNSQSAYALVAMLMTLALVALLARRIATPYPILLVIGGLCLTLVPGVEPPALDPELILLFFLPPLLYYESFHFSWRDFRRWLQPILMLAVGLVAVTACAVAVVAKLLLPELSWASAFILGAIVSPTDTVAAMAVIRRLRIPRRITALLGGESLVNDATALVTFQLAVRVVLLGQFSAADVGVHFAWTAVAGIAVGVVVGWAAARVNMLVQDSTILFVFSLLTPYIAFVVADAVEASGVVAVVVAGFFVAWRIHTIAADTRYQLYAVWRLLTFVIDGLSFVLVGATLPRLVEGSGATAALTSVLWAGALITLTVIVLRVLWVFPAVYVPLTWSRRQRLRQGGYPAPHNVGLVAWCGMRGAVSLAAGLSVPMLAGDQPFPGRDTIVICTVCVVIGTLIVQGLTLPAMIRLLGIRGDEHADEEERLARVSMIQAALSHLDELRQQGAPADYVLLDHVERTYMERLTLLINRPTNTPASDRPPMDVFAVECRTVAAERERLLELRDRADINDQVQAKLQEELDVTEMRLQAARRTETPEPRP